MKRIFVFSLLLLTMFVSHVVAQSNVSQYSGEKAEALDSGIKTRVSATIIYDNYLHNKGLEADWGYALIINGLDKTIMFDTGSNPQVFRNNFRDLKLDAAAIDEVFISHEHGDHFGGLHTFLSMNSDVELVIPETFSDRFIIDYRDECIAIRTIKDPVRICDHLYSTGVMGEAIPEQALVLNTANGLVVMTGCSHPGIIEMLGEIKEVFKKDIYMVFGGFHLMNAADSEIEQIISGMKKLGVQKCGATHCTGERQIELFRKSFGKDFVEMGAGNTLIFE